MKLLAQIISGIALAATLLAPIAFLVNMMPLERMNQILLAAAIAWFIATPFWMGRERDEPKELVVP